MVGAVIADAGPLIALAQVDHLTLLATLFGTLWITPSVRKECLAKPDEAAGRIEAAIRSGWLRVRESAPGPQPLSGSLGPGEKDSIHLALRHPGSLLIIDDRLARRQAARLGIDFVGTVRLLDSAERRGIVADARRVVELMRACGYRIDAHLLDAIRGAT